LNVPATVGVPLIVIVLFAQVAVNPVGKPVTVPMPVAPVVAMVMAGVKDELIQIVRGAVTAAVLFGTTVIVPAALTVPHPPVSGIV
jgi:hypothetical protein